MIPNHHSILTNKGFIPIYKLPVTFYRGSNKLKLSWGLGYFYLKQLWIYPRNGNLGKYVWFRHLKLELITLICLPFILLHNYKYAGESNIFYRDI